MDEDEIAAVVREVLQRRARTAASLTVSQLCAAYLQAYAGSPSLHVMTTRLAPFLAAFGDRAAMSLEVLDWSQHAAERLATPIPDAKGGRCYAKSTINQELTWAKSLYNWAVEQGRVKYNPLAAAKHSKGAKKKRETAPNEREIGLLLGACERPQHTVMVLAACDVGMRRGEILRLRHDWIDHERKTATLPNRACKNNKGGTVPVTGRFLAAVLDVPRHIRYSYVIWGERSDDGRVSRESLNAWWRDIRRRAGVTAAPGDGQVRLHDGRAACATNAIARGVDIATVSKRMMRHASIATTEIYVRGIGGDLSSAIATFEAGIERDQRRNPNTTNNTPSTTEIK